MNRELTKEEREAQKRIIQNKLCMHCEHRKSMFMEKDSKHKRVYCMMQPSNKSVCGYKTIKAHDYACGLYEQKL